MIIKALPEQLNTSSLTGRLIQHHIFRNEWLGTTVLLLLRIEAIAPAFGLVMAVAGAHVIARLGGHAIQTRTATSRCRGLTNRNQQNQCEEEAKQGRMSLRVANDTTENIVRRIYVPREAESGNWVAAIPFSAAI